MQAVEKTGILGCILFYSSSARQHGTEDICSCVSFATLQVCVEVNMADIPQLKGASECLEAGISSTLNPSNVRAADAVTSHLPPASHILTDPQTAGGLLAGIPESQAAACVAELKSLGYPDACSIGKACSSLEPPLLIRLQ